MAARACNWPAAPGSARSFWRLLKEGVSRHLVKQLESDGRLDRVLKDILEKQTDPYSASEALVLETLGPLKDPA